MPLLDTCIITASDERQAAVFRELLERRVQGGLYPPEIDFRVYSDPPAGRVGSGGGTIWALLSLLRDEGLDLVSRHDAGQMGAAADHLSRRRVLIMHAGGESRRLPAYVPEGKIFAPVPAPSSSFLPPVVFDVELSLFLKYPWRDGELLVTSGDTLVDFNTELLDLPKGFLCGFAAPESFERGSRHGVFAFDPITGSVSDYFQKASPEYLSLNARIEGTEACGVDLGLVSFRAQALEALLRCASSALSGGSIVERVAAGRLSLDLYLEILTGCLGGLDRRGYGSRLKGRSAAPTEVLDLIFDSFHPCGLSGVLVTQSAFIHFGSVAEFPSSCRELSDRQIRPFYASAHQELVPEVGASMVRFNSLDTDVQPGSGGVCVENCKGVKIACEGNNLIVGLSDLELPRPLPQGFCIDERRFQDSGSDVTIRLVYHRDDTFKAQSSADQIVFCGQPLRKWLDARGLALTDVLPAEGRADLYAAELFVPGGDAEYLEGYWNAPADKSSWARRFRQARRYSIAAANARTDAGNRDLQRAAAREAELTRSRLIGKH